MQMKYSSWIVINLLEVLVCSITEYFLELCHIARRASQNSSKENKYKQNYLLSNCFISCALFALYEVQLDNTVISDT